MGDPLRHGPPSGAGDSGRDAPVEDTGRVLQFRPRQRPGGFGSPPPSPGRPAVEDIARYERDDRDDDYRHRMLMNVIGLLACVLLIVAGIWIANAIVELRKQQDCVLSGRRNCMQLEVPSRLRW